MERVKLMHVFIKEMNAAFKISLKKDLEVHFFLFSLKARN